MCISASECSETQNWLSSQRFRTSHFALSKEKKKIDETDTAKGLVKMSDQCNSLRI
jgi:hypothetical protein